MLDGNRVFDLCFRRSKERAERKLDGLRVTAMAIEMALCAYCGVYTQTEPEHVVPRSFATDQLRPHCNWVVVRACSDCNRDFSADESDFRAFSVMANSIRHNPVRDALFHGPVSRNWRRDDGGGHGALRRMLAMVWVPEGGDPGNPVGAVLVPDAGTIRAVKKIVRGLYFHHLTPKRRLAQVLPHEQIQVMALYNSIPASIFEFPEWITIHPDVFGYGFSEDAVSDIPGVDSLWLLDAYRGATFFASVASNTFPWVGQSWTLTGGVH
jgi:hypothetical protein